MSFLKFFRREKTVTNDHQFSPVTAGQDKTKAYIERSLFIEEEKPNTAEETKSQNNPLEDYLEQKFEWIGYNDGYSYPDADYMNSKLKVLRSDFRLAVDKIMDAKRVEVGQLRLHLIKTTGISKILEMQINERIKQIEIQIHELDTQKILSIEGEGIVSSSLHSYRLGFIKGIEHYQHEKLLASSTGLFN